MKHQRLMAHLVDIIIFVSSCGWGCECGWTNHLPPRWFFNFFQLWDLPLKIVNDLFYRLCSLISTTTYLHPLAFFFLLVAHWMAYTFVTIVIGIEDHMLYEVVYFFYFLSCNDVYLLWVKKLYKDLTIKIHGEPHLQILPFTTSLPFKW